MGILAWIVSISAARLPWDSKRCSILPLGFPQCATVMFAVWSCVEVSGGEPALTEMLIPVTAASLPPAGRFLQAYLCGGGAAISGYPC